MKILHKLLLGATLCVACACSQSEWLPEELENGTGQAGTGSGLTRELVLEFDNSLQPIVGQTRAGGNSIATDAENNIVSLDIYLFGSTEEEGNYTFMEHLTYRSNQSVVEGATPFELYPSGSHSGSYNAILNITKGLFVKMYCVANQTDLFMLTPKAGDMYPDATFKKLTLDTQTGIGEIKAPGLPTEADFQSKYLLRVLTPQTTILSTPLPMVGNVAGPLDLTNLVESSRMHTNLKLKRAVSRFDIVNTAEKSRLTINSIGMEGGNATTTLFPMIGQPSAEGKMITYPERSFADDDEINKGGRTSAYYSYAAPADACLVLNGQYKLPSEEIVKVSYKVPFHSIKNQEGVNVAIQPNHRYTVTVNEADAYEVKLTIKVADWEEGGQLDEYNPSDANAIKLTAINLVGDVRGTNIDYKLRTVDTTNGNSGSISFKSNSKITAQISYAGGDTSHKWLKFAEPNVSGQAGESTYVFVPNVTQNVDHCYPPAIVTFTNTTGSQVVLELHSHYLWSEGSAYTANLMDNGSKRYLIAKTKLDQGVTNWNDAMTRCPAKDGWRLPSMNDMRQLIKMYEWDTKPYLKPGSVEYTETFDNKIHTYSGTPTKGQFGNYAAIYNSADFIYYGAFYWLSDINPKNSTQAGCVYSSSYTNVNFSFKEKKETYRVRCIKDWN